MQTPIYFAQPPSSSRARKFYCAPGNSSLELTQKSHLQGLLPVSAGSHMCTANGRLTMCGAKRGVWQAGAWRNRRTVWMAG